MDYIYFSPSNKRAMNREAYVVLYFVIFIVHFSCLPPLWNRARISLFFAVRKLFTSWNQICVQLWLLKVHIGEKPCKYTHCDKQFSKSRSLWRNLKVQCGSGSLQRYHKVHSGEKPYKSTHCDKRSSESESLWRHLKVHCGEKPYKCTHCHKCFSLKSNLIVQDRSYHRNWPYKCSYCSKGFEDQRRDISVDNSPG